MSSFAALPSSESTAGRYHDVCRMQKHALDNFKRVGVDVRTGVRVTEVSHLKLPLSAACRGLYQDACFRCCYLSLT